MTVPTASRGKESWGFLLPEENIHWTVRILMAKNRAACPILENFLTRVQHVEIPAEMVLYEKESYWRLPRQKRQHILSCVVRKTLFEWDSSAIMSDTDLRVEWKRVKPYNSGWLGWFRNPPTDGVLNVEDDYVILEDNCLHSEESLFHNWCKETSSYAEKQQSEFNPENVALILMWNEFDIQAPTVMYHKPLANTIAEEAVRKREERLKEKQHECQIHALGIKRDSHRVRSN